LLAGKLAEHMLVANQWRITMMRTLFAAAAAVTLMSGIALADDTTTTTRQSTEVGPMKFETDRTVRDSDDHMRGAGATQIEKHKTITKDSDGDTTTRSRTESTTVR
jgi:hypothetical protein